MKLKSIGAILVLIQAGSWAGDFGGFDEFTSSAKDTNRWGAEFAEGTGQLIQTNTRVHFVTGPAPEGDDFIAWPWQLGHGPWDRDWRVQLDVQVPYIPLAPGHTAVGVGIVVVDSGNFDNNFSMHLEQVRSNGPQMRNFFNAVEVQGDNTEFSIAAPSESGSVQIRWSATNQTLTAWWDGTGGVDGYNWTLLNTFQPGLTTNWNMGPSRSFLIAVVGYAEGTAVSLTNQVFMDNFFLEDESRMRLRIAPSGTNVAVSWPAEAISFRLQSSLNVTGVWAGVTAPTAVADGRRQVTLPATGREFFRLKQDD